MIMLLLLAVSSDGLFRHSGSYQQCSRATCQQVDDAGSDWEFDQPPPILLSPQLRGHLEGGDRLRIHFASASNSESASTSDSASNSAITIGGASTSASASASTSASASDSSSTSASDSESDSISACDSDRDSTSANDSTSASDRAPASPSNSATGSASTSASEGEVPLKIHIIWVGSPLPEKYTVGPVSFALKNPGYSVHLWLDQPTTYIQTWRNLRVENITAEVWPSDDLLEQCTNYAMASDILRLEIVRRYGGIYVDVDAVALRSFGPVFHRPFLTVREAGWLDKDLRSLTGIHERIAGVENSPLGFAAFSPFLAFTLAALRLNFPTQTATLYKTGPVLLKEALLQYSQPNTLTLLSWQYLGRAPPNGEHAILVDTPGQSDWSDKQDVRLSRLQTSSVILDSPGPGQLEKSELVVPL